MIQKGVSCVVQPMDLSAYRILNYPVQACGICKHQVIRVGAPISLLVLSPPTAKADWFQLSLICSSSVSLSSSGWGQHLRYLPLLP